MKWTALILALLAHVAMGAGGTAKRHMKFRYPGASEDDPVACGAHSDENGDATPNKIRQCFYTDCFDKTKTDDFPFVRNNRRRLKAPEWKIPYRPYCKGQGVLNYNQGSYAWQSSNNTVLVTGPGGVRRQTYQWKYYDQGVKKLEKVDTCGESMTSAMRAGESRKDVKAVQTGAGMPGNCLYETPPTNCQCRSIYCIVEMNEESSADKPITDLVKHDCNFLVRIEAQGWGPSLAKYTMWVIFGLSAFTGLAVTAYFYIKFGDELVKGGGSNASGN